MVPSETDVRARWAATLRDHEEAVEPPPLATLTQGRITCGCCGRRVSFADYGPWNALACLSCRARAS